MGRSPIQGILLDCLKGFIISEGNYESHQAKGPKPIQLLFLR